MASGFIIRDTVTGAQFYADSGKGLWSTTGAAKNAWRQSYLTLKHLGIPSVETRKWYDPGSFNDQARFVLEELTASGDRLKQAEELLAWAHDYLDDVHAYDSDVAEAIRKYFGEED
ncbi:hypothetical protein D3C78_1532580 [compost metagenome]